ncbi:class I SAM-dependent methyltransferase [Pseudomonas sp. CJQ_7]|uniref:class I SAM-dependent methyltransferase n=1 Tax=Pseudomonas sp. CJQ_7 TaxID=3367166 RepID=UPI00370C992A
MNLWQDFLTNDDRLIHKWTHYFPIYEKHLTEWRNKTITVLEIGVSKGGSLQMWKRFFGPLATIVGIDINSDCQAFEEDGIHVRIGDQSDPDFLSRLVEEFGPFDIVLDDGSHQMEHIRKSFEYLYPKVSKNGIYIIEDLHTAYWPEYGGGKDNPSTFINISKQFIDDLNADHSRGAIEPNFITRFTFSISYYDSVIVFQRGNIPLKKAPQVSVKNLASRLLSVDMR